MRYKFDSIIYFVSFAVLLFHTTVEKQYTHVGYYDAPTYVWLSEEVVFLLGATGSVVKIVPGQISRSCYWLNSGFVISHNVIMWSSLVLIK